MKKIILSTILFLFFVSACYSQFELTQRYSDIKGIHDSIIVKKDEKTLYRHSKSYYYIYEFSNDSCRAIYICGSIDKYSLYSNIKNNRSIYPAEKEYSWYEYVQLLNQKWYWLYCEIVNIEGYKYPFVKYILKDKK